MNANVGYTDRIVRIVAGVLVLSLFFVLEGDARWVGLAGIVLIGTALVRWCPIYRVLGLSTQGSKSA
jgi:hypothetical protein